MLLLLLLFMFDLFLFTRFFFLRHKNNSTFKATTTTTNNNNNNNGEQAACMGLQVHVERFHTVTSLHYLILSKEDKLGIDEYSLQTKRMPKVVSIN
jgi:hypothetical protein